MGGRPLDEFYEFLKGDVGAILESCEVWVLEEEEEGGTMSGGWVV